MPRPARSCLPSRPWDAAAATPARPSATAAATRHGPASGSTSTLRNVAVTPLYRADGRATNLADVLRDDFHRGHRPAPPGPGEESQLVAFHEALTGTASAEHRPTAALTALPSLPDRWMGGLY